MFTFCLFNSRKRKNSSVPDPDVADIDNTVKISRHAKHWKSLYAPAMSKRVLYGDEKECDIDADVNDESIFGWLGSLFSSS